MKEIKTVALCGLGAVGSMYATNIFDFDRSMIKIVADEKRIEKYKEVPLIYNGKEYDFDYVLPENGRTVDLILVATKASGLQSAIKSIKKFIGENTIIMSLMNGITSEDELAKVYGDKNIVYSYYVGHTMKKVDRNVEYDGVGKTVFGNKLNRQKSENVLAVEDFAKKIGLVYEIPEDMNYAMWKKFTLNVGVNQSSSILRAVYKYIQNCPKCLEFTKNLMREVEPIAKAEGVKDSEKMLKEAIDTIFAMKPDAKTSMYQDVCAKRKTEVDLFAGTVVELGKKHKIQTPYNKMVLEIMTAVDEMTDFNE